MFCTFYHDRTLCLKFLVSFKGNRKHKVMQPYLSFVLHEDRQMLEYNDAPERTKQPNLSSSTYTTDALEIDISTLIVPNSAPCHRTTRNIQQTQCFTKKIPVCYVYCYWNGTFKANAQLGDFGLWFQDSNSSSTLETLENEYTVIVRMEGWCWHCSWPTNISIDKATSRRTTLAFA